MPKLLEYPRRSLSDALELAETVSSLGGKCSIETCAESMKKKTGGSFSALISAAVKYGLVTSKSGGLAVTEQFNNYRLAYDEEERLKLFRQTFLSVPLFSQVLNRFRHEELPPGHILKKILIREFDVRENLAGAVYPILHRRGHRKRSTHRGRQIRRVQCRGTRSRADIRP